MLLAPRWAALFTYHPGIISGAESHCARARAVNVCVIWQFLVKESISSLLMIIQMEFLHGLPKEKKSYYAMGFKNVLIVYF